MRKLKTIKIKSSDEMKEVEGNIGNGKQKIEVDDDANNDEINKEKKEI